MTALTSGRNTAEATGVGREGAVAAGAKIFEGAILMRDANGNLVQGQSARGLIGVGRAGGRADNTSGAAGDARVSYHAGIFAYANATSSEAITEADIGKICYALDDQTVSKTDGGGARSPAGFVAFIDESGVWVHFDEMMARLA